LNISKSIGLSFDQLALGVESFCVAIGDWAMEVIKDFFFPAVDCSVLAGTPKLGH
jgi:hypothetical protein